MGLIDTAQSVYELAGKGMTIELREKLMEMREEALGLQEQNLALRERVAELERAAELGRELTFDGRIYWHAKDDGEKDGPFCQRCYDADGKMIRLQSDSYMYEGQRHSWWKCHQCESSYDAD